PVHRTDIQRGLLVEPFHAICDKAEPGLDRHGRLQPQRLGGLIDARAVKIEIGRHPVEGARPVEHRGTEPGRMRARPHEGNIALVPVPGEKRPRLGWRGCKSHVGAHSASAARMRAQLRMPWWNEARSYFSFGEWMRSSSRPKPISNVSMPSLRLKSATIGTDAPDPMSAASLPHSSASARRAAPSAGMLQSSAIAGAAAWLMNSALQSAGSRARTKARKASRMRSGS